jgi:hypothetical protein
MKLLLTISQVFLLAYTTFVGIAAVFGEFRDSQHHITPFGKWMICTTFFALVLGCTSQFIQAHIEALESKSNQYRLEAQMKLQNQTLENVRRMLMPIQHLEISLLADLTADNKPISEVTTEMLNQMPRSRPPYRLYPYFPQESATDFWWQARNMFESVYYYNPGAQAGSDIPTNMANLSFSVGFDSKDPTHSVSYTLDLNRKCLTGNWWPIISNLRYDETMTSTHDFAGKVIAISLMPGAPATTLKFMRLTTQSGLTLEITGFTKTTMGPRTFFIATIPNDARWN